MKKFMTSAFVMGVCFMTIVFLFIAVHNAFFHLEKNGCEMTYMFEYPEYIKIKLKKKLLRNFPRYNLFLYGEGGYAQELRGSGLSGIPVLFIPGNAGSYRQVRSLASVALRKAESHKNHFNYFTIDFDEDFSGLYGGVLKDQVNFVHNCLKHIIRMYQGSSFVQDSVVVIGHSMGGMIARALFTLDKFQSKSVSLLITLGTPHVESVVPFDINLNTFYLEVNNFWRSNPTVGNLSVVSLAGGARDIMVPARYCSLTRSDSHYSAVTTAVPRIWLTIDHLALCWCKQLILVINRVLFKLIDEGTNRITKDERLKKQVLRQHFEISIEPKEMLRKSRIHENGRIYNDTNLWNRFEDISVSGKILIPVDTKREDAQFIALSNRWEDISIMSCVSLNTCQMAAIQPLPSREKGFVHLTELANLSYIKVSSLTDRPRLTTMQFSPRSAINKQYDNFQLLSGVQRFSSVDQIFINISLPMIRNCFDVYMVTVKTVGCKSDRKGTLTGRTHLPWSHEDIYARPTHSTGFTILLKPHTSKPTVDSRTAQLHIWNTDKCSVEVTIEYKVGETLGGLFIHYAPLVPQWIYFWIIIVLVIQLRQLSDKNNSLSIWSTVTSSELLGFSPLFMLFLLKPWIRWSDASSQSYGPVLYEWLLPSSFVILTAFVIFLALHLILEITMSSLVCFLSICLSTNKNPQNQTSSTLSLLYYSSLGFLLLSLASLCSSTAVYLLTMVVFIHSCKVKLQYRQIFSNSAEVINKLNFSKLLLIVLLTISFQTTPAFIVWLKVLPMSWQVPNDPNLSLVLLLIPSVVCLFEMNISKPHKYLSYVVLSLWSLGFLTLSLDRLPYIVGYLLLLIDFFVFTRNIDHEKTW